MFSVFLYLYPMWFSLLVSDAVFLTGSNGLGNIIIIIRGLHCHEAHVGSFTLLWACSTGYSKIGGFVLILKACFYVGCTIDTLTMVVNTG